MIFDSVIYSYGNKNVLRGIYLKIHRSSLVGIFGLNGSGKSTLLKIGAGLLVPQNGNVFINSECFNKSMRIKRYSHIAYLPQESFLPKDLTLSELEKNIPTLKSVIEEDKLLIEKRNLKVASLSGGELRYLEIKLLFSLERDYYLLDEPFTGVEPNLIDILCKFIINQKNLGKGILITDHYYRYVTKIIDNHTYSKMDILKN